MKPFRPNKCRGLTLIELLCVILVVSLLAALLLPVLGQGKDRARRVRCVSQLAQIGIAFSSFAHDHQGRFPMQLPSSAGGTLEIVHQAARMPGEPTFVFRHFQAVSNELGSTRLLICPADQRLPARSFATLSNNNLSYFFIANAKSGDPTGMLAGDRNLVMDGSPGQSRFEVTSTRSARWTAELHRFKGNVVFVDGHVEQLNGPALNTGTLARSGVRDQLWLPSPNPVGLDTHLTKSPRRVIPPPPPSFYAPDPGETAPVKTATLWGSGQGVAAGTGREQPSTLAVAEKGSIDALPTSARRLDQTDSAQPRTDRTGSRAGINLSLLSSLMLLLLLLIISLLAVLWSLRRKFRARPVRSMPAYQLPRRLVEPLEEEET